MEEKKWNNRTKKHPGGVCEAATSLWLQRISYKGIAVANTLKPEECDDLQTKCESGEYSWAVDLLDLLGGTPKASFDAFQTTQLKKQADAEKLLEAMVENDFRYISATGQSASGHATALYRKNNEIYFFDPNYAIYWINISKSKSEIPVLAKKIMENLKHWSDITSSPGKFK